ncbi:UNVERIFIED_CONTAM: Patatin-like protein 2 [Sesamum radiatum]|uniref:Patatin n=1 Tax=Sesamum radiatum TaxID=300843 RepID=A0AAW2PZ77_SESRA
MANYWGGGILDRIGEINDKAQVRWRVSSPNNKGESWGDSTASNFDKYRGSIFRHQEFATYDILHLRVSYLLVRFKINEAKQKQILDSRLSDICMGTSAAPTYLPPYCFKNQDCQGNIREFNLVDGGVAANNPALVAISQVTKQVLDANPEFFPIKPTDFGRFLVISLGTGSPKVEKHYSAQKAAKWGALGWLIPIAGVFAQASADMVDFLIALVFQALHSEQNYLRIQLTDMGTTGFERSPPLISWGRRQAPSSTVGISRGSEDNLSGTTSSLDLATKENLEKLVEIGGNLLKKPASRVNLETGLFEPIENGGTNEEALVKFAKLLSEEKKIRESRFV